MLEHVFTDILILLFVAVLVSALFNRFRLPSIVGYLCTGLVLGPSGLNLLHQSLATQTFAEFGVVFLLFTVGLEFSLPRLLAMKKIVVVGGGLQVLLTSLIAAAIANFIGLNIVQAIIIGFVVAMSSTAIVLKQLTEQLELNSKHGRTAVAILLFQDLAAIPILILIPMLAAVSTSNVAETLFDGFIKGCIIVLLIIIVGRGVLRPLFHKIAKFHSTELFMLSILLITLGSAWLTHQFHLSLALGAFLAGMMLGETEYRHQIEADIRPFRDITLAIFFIVIGMLLDTNLLMSYYPWIILLTAGLIFFKGLVISLISRIFITDMAHATRTGIILAQGSEFSFAILNLALASQLLSITNGQIVLASLVLSMLFAPSLIRYNRAIAYFLLPKSFRQSISEDLRKVRARVKGLKNHIIICGYGRVGQNIARLLETESLPYIGIDLDPVLIQNALLAGDNVTYGDVTHHGILEAAKTNKASAMVISFTDIAAAAKVLEQARHLAPQLPIIVRAYDDSDFTQLHQAGAVEVIPETLETSLILAAHLLALMKIPAPRILRRMREVRANRYQLLREIYSGELLFPEQVPKEFREQLFPITLPDHAFAVGAQLQQIPFKEMQVRVHGIRRADGNYCELNNPKLILQSGDVIILYGSLSNLERAEEYLLQG